MTNSKSRCHKGCEFLELAGWLPLLLLPPRATARTNRAEQRGTGKGGRGAGYLQSGIYADEMRQRKSQSLVRTDDYDYRAAAVAASPSLTLKASCVLQLWETPQVEAATEAADALVLRFLIN